GLSCTTCPNPTASPDVTTVYTVTGVNGCFTTTDQVIVTVNPDVNANAFSDVTICPGDSVQIFATGGVNYSWSPSDELSDPNISDPIATVSSTTTFTALVTNQFGCSDTASVTVSVFDVPQVTVSNDTTIYLGNSVQLEATGGVSYSWSPSTYLNDPT